MKNDENLQGRTRLTQWVTLYKTLCKKTSLEKSVGGGGERILKYQERGVDEYNTSSPNY